MAQLGHNETTLEKDANFLFTCGTGDCRYDNYCARSDGIVGIIKIICFRELQVLKNSLGHIIDVLHW